jgi:hypothetical protein
MTAEPNIHLEDPVSTKIVQCVLHKSNIHGMAATAKPLITESNDGVTVIKPGHQTTGNMCMIWSDESTFTLFPT